MVFDNNVSHREDGNFNEEQADKIENNVLQEQVVLSAPTSAGSTRAK